MKRALAVLTAAALLAAPAGAAQNFSSKNIVREVRVEAPRATHELGEKLVYDVYWMGVHVGFGSLEVTERVERADGREAFHVVAVAETNEFLSKIYPVRDEIHSFIDTENFHSVEFRKKLSEGKYRADEAIVYDYAQKKGFYESFKNQGKKEVEIPVPVHDIVSAFYWFRLQPLEVGKSVKTVVNSEEKNQDVDFRVLKAEAKEIRGRGVVDTVMVEPVTKVQGVLYQRGRAWVHFSADARRVPVWITLKTPFGPVAGILRDSEKPVR